VDGISSRDGWANTSASLGPAPRPLRPLLRALDQDHDRVELAWTRVGVAANGMRDVDESAVAEAALQLAVQLSFHVGHGRPDTAMASTAIADGYPGGPRARRPLAPIPRLLTTGPGDPCLIGPRWYGHPEPGEGGM
jgi:hypothetical protein